MHKKLNVMEKVIAAVPDAKDYYFKEEEDSSYVTEDYVNQY